MNPKAAVITVPCGVMGQSGKGDKGCKAFDNDHDADDATTVELYSGGVLIYTESSPMIYVNGDEKQSGTASIVLTGNGTHFKSWYEDASTSWLNSPDLTVKVWAKGHSKKSPQLALFQPYMPVASAIWAEHTLDGANFDAELQAEVTRAKGAESGLSGDLAAERAARIAADNGLTSSIAAEATRAQAAEAANSSALAAETAARSAADAGLQAAVTAEVARAQGAEGGLAASLAGETARAQTAEAALGGAVAAETARAQGAEAGLQNGLDAEVAARKAGDMALQAAIDGETTRAQGAESALSTALATETARAKSAEATLNTRVNNEIDRATTAENTITTNLNNEVARATGAESALSAALTAETTRATGAESALSAAIAAEAAARQAGDAANLAAANAYTDAQVGAEAAARGAADAALSQAIVTETGRASAAEATLTAALNAESMARAMGDAVTLAAAQAFAANAVNAESAARQAADAALQAAITAEQAARIAGDAATLAAANAYTDSRTPWPQSCPVGQEIVSTGNGTWACADDAAGVPTCNNGQIIVSQGGPNYVCRDICSGAIVDVTNDVNNCGSCGNFCYNTDQVAATGCGGGACNVQACNGGFLDCNTQWADGCECGNLANASPACNGGACAIGQCNQNYLDCDGQVGNGCECGKRPHSSPGCNGGACGIGQCDAGYADCDGNPNNGCETNTTCENANCGACGVVCGANQGCVMGQCQGGGQPVTQVYDINALNMLDNLSSECSGTGQYPYNGCNGQPYGFHWTSVGQGATSIKIEFETGINCSGNRAVALTLNGQALGNTQLLGGNCACNPAVPGVQTITINNPAGYNSGGVNNLRFTAPPSCEGLAKNKGLGPDFARVTVVYGGPPAGCAPNAGGGGVCGALFPNANYNSGASFQDQLQGTTMTIAWDGANYWSSSGGSNNGVRFAEYDGNGNPVATFQPGLDFRSVFTVDNNSGPVYAKECGNAGQIHRMVNPGNFVPDVFLQNPGNAYDCQTGIVFNPGGTEFVGNQFGVITRWDRNGNVIQQFSLQGFGNQNNENQYPQGRGVVVICGMYFTYSNQVLSAWDGNGNRVKQTTLSGAGTSFDSHFGFSYANGKFWVVDNAGGTWRGYDVGQ